MTTVLVTGASGFISRTLCSYFSLKRNMVIGVARKKTLSGQTIYDDQTQRAIVKVCPGLSGIGSIIFRGEEDILSGAKNSLDFYKFTIAPYKGALEIWFVENNNILNYFKAILVTVVVVISPRSQIAWRAFEGLPVPPDDLKDVLNFPGTDQ